MLNLSIKKNLLYKICSRLRETQYWNYTPVLTLLSWFMGFIIEDELGWGNLMKQVFKNQFKGFQNFDNTNINQNFKK